MTEPYAGGFAQAYDEHWQLYPTRAAAQLLRLHQQLAPAAPRRLLDVGCGTGIVAAHFQQAGYAVTGLDASPAMLARARDRLGAEAVLIRGDATDFTLAETFPLAISTYDIPNHLGGLDRIACYLRAVFRAVAPGGLFVFDVATRKGLLGINTVSARETDDSIVLYRGALNEPAGYGFYRISGAVRAPDGRYDRFETTITNSIVPLGGLLAAVGEAGWRDTYLAAPADLSTPLPADSTADSTAGSTAGSTADVSAAAEALPRVCVISRRP